MRSLVRFGRVPSSTGPALISVKLKTGRAKDRMVVPLLVASSQEPSEPKEPRAER